MRIFSILTIFPEVGMPYTVTPYSFVHPHHAFPHQPFAGSMPPHRVAIPPQPPNMQIYHAYPPHPGHPVQHPQLAQHPHHPPPTQPPTVPQFYAPQPTVTTVNVHPPPGTQHMFTMQQPVPVNVTIYF